MAIIPKQSDVANVMKNHVKRFLLKRIRNIMKHACAIIILGINFVSIPADLIAASSRTASIFDNFFLCANPASKKKTTVMDISHKKIFLVTLKGSPNKSPPPLLLDDDLIFEAFL